jgi:hypothetical protein
MRGRSRFHLPCCACCAVQEELDGLLAANAQEQAASAARLAAAQADLKACQDQLTDAQAGAGMGPGTTGPGLGGRHLDRVAGPGRPQHP